MRKCCVCMMTSRSWDCKALGASFHAFPTKRPELCKKWMQFAGIPEGESLKEKCVCSSHFKDEDVVNSPVKRRIKPNAYPCLNPPIARGVITVQDPGELEMSVSLSLDTCADMEHAEGRLDSSPRAGPSSEMDLQQDLFITPTHKRVGGVLSSIGETRVKNLTPRKRLLYNALQERNLKIKNLRARVKALSKWKGSSKKRHILELADEIGDHISPHFYSLLKAQLSNQAKSPSGRRWSIEVKILCLALRKLDLRSYKFLRMCLLLPSPETLLRICNRFPLHAGLNDVLLHHLKERLTEMPQNSKICSLIFDEMSIQKNISFNPSGNYIFGFEDLGHNRRCHFADHALVFMVRGLIVNWKQPVAYYLVHGSIHATDLEKIIVDVIENLQNIGFKIMAIVSDQASANLLSLKRLATKTCNWNRPVIEINNQRIVVISDPPHVLKSTRNAIFNNKLFFESGSGEEKVADWQHVKDILALENRDSAAINFPELSEDHFNLKRKMKVKLAAQVLSGSVAYALYHYSNLKHIEGAKFLAEFVSDVNNLFDSFNSEHNSRDKAKFRKPVTESSVHFEFWKQMNRKLATWRFVGPDGKPARTKVQESWRRNIDAVITLWRMLEDEGVESLQTRRLNQDPLENLFGVVRQHGVRNINPTSQQFDTAMKTAIINCMVGASEKFNCENDGADILDDLKKLIMKTNNVSVPVRQVCDDDSLTPYLKGSKEREAACAWILSLPPQVSSSNLEEASKRAAHIISKIKNLQSCFSCFQSIVICHHSPPSEGSRTMCSCSHPNQNFIEKVWEMRILMFRQLQIRGHVHNILQEICKCVQNFNLENFGCFEHNTQIQNCIKLLLSRKVIDEFCCKVSSSLKMRR